MKITSHNGRADANGRHNDRNFDVRKAKHIDPNRIKDDIFWTYNGDKEHTFREVELDFYKEHFDDYLKDRNDKCLEQKKKNRVISAEEYSKRRNSRPEDKILQIGNIDQHASKEELWECVMDYQKRFDELYGDHCKIVDIALHADEETPHVQLRRVWIAHDENGNEYVNQTNALKELGISRPSPDLPEGKRNNAKMTFTQTDRELFREVCIEHGLEIDPEIPSKRQHLDTLDYKIQQEEKELHELEKKVADKDAVKDDSQELYRTVDHMTDFLAYMPMFHGEYTKELEESKEQPLDERAKTVTAILTQEVEQALRDRESYMEFLDKAAEKENMEKEIRTLKQYISETGHTQDYYQFLEDLRIREERKRQQEKDKQYYDSLEEQRDWDGDGIADGFEAAADRWSI